MVFAWCYHGALEELSRRCIHLHSAFMGSHYSSTMFLAWYFYGLPWNMHGIFMDSHGTPVTYGVCHGQITERPIRHPVSMIYLSIPHGVHYGVCHGMAHGVRHGIVSCIMNHPVIQTAPFPMAYIALHGTPV